jgi:potassium-transporting ATPase ATP-binding subunit
MMSAQKRSVLEREILVPAIGATFAKLDPRHLLKNPVMFVTEVGALVTTAEVFRASANGESLGFVLQVALWLWFTVLFANFAEALAEGRGKAQADALRKTRTKTFANRGQGCARESVVRGPA